MSDEQVPISSLSIQDLGSLKKNFEAVSQLENKLSSKNIVH